MSEGHAHTSDDANDSHGHPGARGDVPLSASAMRVMAIQQLLVEKGVIGPDQVRRGVEAIDTRSPADGARVVARAWVDSDFKGRLLADPRAAVAELGFTLASDSELAVMENTEDVHHVVVCTLCSCYPVSLLGLPPDWYKSLAYRSRAVSDPRSVMREFGLVLEDGVEVRVVDSTADLRYLVLPGRPAGTDGMSEEELAKLVTRDSMIGVAAPRSPELAPAAGD